MPSTPLLQIKGLTKEYGPKKHRTRVLGPLDFTVEAGSYTVILGKSGSGKSTLLNLLAGLDQPTTGALLVNGKDIAKISRKRLAKYRSEIGIIFQFYNLLPTLNVLENVRMGGWAGGNSISAQKAKELLDSLRLSHRENANVSTLSGGEKQRVAIARALVNNPQILFCDEPTGALDSKNEQQVKEIIKYLHSQGITVIMVTHNEEFAADAQNIIFLQDGLIKPYSPTAVALPTPRAKAKLATTTH